MSDHGSPWRYHDGCRCDECRAAAAEYARLRRARLRERGNLPPDDPRHGTVNGYNNLQCRCEPCRAAWVACNYPYRLKHRREVLGMLPVDERRALRAAKHGTRSKYVRGCRCEPCRGAQREYDRQRRAEQKAFA